jgi:Fe-S-cluster-containing hydrogenase component 2
MKLFIDLDICESCKECTAKCSYYYHPQNDGVISLREIATFSLVCRHCDQGTCILACPKDALERLDTGIVKRYNMRCISCKSCSFACPFGTIYPEIVPYISSICDYCQDRLDEIPLCVRTCNKEEAIKFIEDVEEDKEKGIYKINENLYVHSTRFWVRV